MGTLAWLSQMIQRLPPITSSSFLIAQGTKWAARLSLLTPNRTSLCLWIAGYHCPQDSAGQLELFLHRVFRSAPSVLCLVGIISQQSRQRFYSRPSRYGFAVTQMTLMTVFSIS